MDAHWPWLVGFAAATVLLVGLAGWRLVQMLDSDAKALAGRIGRLPWRAKARLAWALLRDRRVPLWVRAVIPALMLYLAMPIDIIPDFIPVFGQLDDVAVVIVAGGVLLRFTPPAIIEEHVVRLERGGKESG